MKKQIKVIFLCVSMILATTVTAFAESSEEERNIGIAEKYENVVVTEVAVEENETGITSLRVEDYPNGDVLSVLKRGNEIISSSYLDRERQQVITRDHETGETNVVTIL